MGISGGQSYAAPSNPMVQQGGMAGGEGGSCGMEGGSCGEGTPCDSSVFWISAAFVYWHIRDPQVPPLLTTGSALDAHPGAMGQPSTFVAYGAGEQDLGWFSGGRFSAGAWLLQGWGMEGDFLFLGARSQQNNYSSNGNLLLALPYLSPSGAESAFVVGSPNLTGRISTEWSTLLYGFEANLINTGIEQGMWGITWLGGFRFLELDEGLQLNVQDTVVGAGQPLPAGTSTAFNDNFTTRNRFFGAQVGARGDWQFGRLTVNASARVALGPVDEIVQINGSNSRTVPGGATSTTPGGFYTQPTNMGYFTASEFCVVPEGKVNFDLMITPHLHATAGYSYLYMTDVVRPGDQIDRTVNPTQLQGGTLVGEGTPVSTRHTTDFWTHALNLGLEFRY
jgi:hypothetical protein